MIAYIQHPDLIPTGKAGDARGKICCQLRNQILCIGYYYRCRVLMICGDINIIVIVMPAIIIGDHGNASIANLGFTRQLGFGHIGHANDIAAPRAIHETLCPGGKLRPLHGQIGAAAHMDDLSVPWPLFQLARPAKD